MRKQWCSCIPKIYTPYSSQLGIYLTITFPFQIYNTQSRIFILKGYFITLLYFTFCIQLRTFNLFRLNTWFFKRRIVHFHYFMLQSFDLSFARKQFCSCIPRLSTLRMFINMRILEPYYSIFQIYKTQYGILKVEGSCITLLYLTCYI